jgi:quercetin dioxygenase-like cupin family protein
MLFLSMIFFGKPIVTFPDHALRPDKPDRPSSRIIAADRLEGFMGMAWRTTWRVSGFALGFCLAGVLAAAADDEPGLKVTRIIATKTTASGQPIVLPQKNVEVRASIYEIPVGMRLPVHKHPSARYAYVLAGKLRVSDADSGRTFDYSAGDFIVEMIDTWHYGANIGTEPVRLLVIDQLESGRPDTVLAPPAAEHQAVGAAAGDR